MTRRWGRILRAALVVGAVLFAGYRVVTDEAVRNAAAVDLTSVEEQVAVRPLANDCSGGYAVLTFDGSPRQHTDELLDRLEALDLTAVFFWAGQNIEGREDPVRRAVEARSVLSNHSVSHPDLTTGKLPNGDRVSPWGRSRSARSCSASTTCWSSTGRRCRSTTGRRTAR
jgi:peptidoglycan-N-acetylglucosamine deacetylase